MRCDSGEKCVSGGAREADARQAKIIDSMIDSRTGAEGRWPLREVQDE